ncbi:MAG: FkbM family methyltransferase [Anaerolineales bacterium]|nr:FkbM family methyltransferase [Anaerolineales bacterium]
MISPKTRILDYLERRVGWKIHRQETVSLLGKSYRLIRGTVRQKADYDDAWLLALAREAHIVFDVGSNIGQSAVLLFHSGPIEQMILIDPNPSALSQAAENLILNGWSDKARFICAFASDQSNETKEFFTVGTGAAGSMYAANAATASALGASFTVSTVTVDELVERHQIVPDLVKIDVEGAETLVLQGARNLAQKQVTRFFVEMHSVPGVTMSENARQVLDWCNQYSYNAWYLKEKTQLIEPAQIATRGRCHLLLLPAHFLFPSYLCTLAQSDPLEKVHIS